MCRLPVSYFSETAAELESYHGTRNIPPVYVDFVLEKEEADIIRRSLGISSSDALTAEKIYDYAESLQKQKDDRTLAQSVPQKRVAYVKAFVQKILWNALETRWYAVTE